jgi:hypothetical protein
MRTLKPSTNAPKATNEATTTKKRQSKKTATLSSTSTPSEKTTVGAIGHVNQTYKNNLKLTLAKFAGVNFFYIYKKNIRVGWSILLDVGVTSNRSFH